MCYNRHNEKEKIDGDIPLQSKKAVASDREGRTKKWQTN